MTAMMRNMRARREAPAGAQVNIPVVNRRTPGMSNQARLRRLGGGEPGQMLVTVSHSDSGVPLNTRDPDAASSAEVSTVEPGMDGGAAPADAGAVAGAPAAPAPDAGAPPPAAPAAGTTACNCELASGPSYTPSGSIPVTNASGRKSASFNMAASFVNNPAANKLPSCCSVRQFILWDSTFHTWRGGPPHSGFPASSPAGTWIEDRDDKSPDGRYGHRSGPHSQPFANCEDEYRTGAARDMLNGDTYCGADNPHGPSSMVGSFQFQLVVFQTGGAVAARSSVITVTWT
jgi:hypothetical protein